MQSQMAPDNLLFRLKLSVTERVLKMTDNLSKTLRTLSLSAGEIHGLVQMIGTMRKRMRSDEAVLWASRSHSHSGRHQWGQRIQGKQT